MSTRVTSITSALSASSEGPPLGALPETALHNILQRACADSDPPDLAHLLLSSKKIRGEVLACCKALVRLEFVTARTAAEAEAFAQWLGKYGQLASSLRFCTAFEWDSDEDEDEDPIVRNYHQNRLAQFDAEAERDRSLIESAVAAGLQLAANNNSESAGAGLYLRACTLYDAGPNIAAVLQQLPASHLTSLQLRICQPNSSNVSPGTYLRPLLSSFAHLTNLRSMKLSFDDRRPSGLDPMIEQMSSLTRLTSLDVSRIARGSALEYLPRSLQRLDVQWTYPEVNPLFSLGHLTVLTNLRGIDHVRLCSKHVLPPNLPQLEVADIADVEPLLPLTKLEALSLTDGYEAAAANLLELTVLAALSYVKVYSNCWDQHMDIQDRARLRLKVIRQALTGLPSLKQIICDG